MKRIHKGYLDKWHLFFTIFTGFLFLCVIINQIVSGYVIVFAVLLQNLWWLYEPYMNPPENYKLKLKIEVLRSIIDIKDEKIDDLEKQNCSSFSQSLENEIEVVMK
jgi:hypothetical protein